MRAVSTVLDVSLALLLTSAAIGVLTAPGPLHGPAPTAGPSADPAAALVATTTANVSYRAAPAAGRERAAAERYADGTLASLLVAAAMSQVRVGGVRLDGAGGGLVAGVKNRTRARLAPLSGRTNVTVAWRAVGTAGPTARLAVGPTPPRATRVRAARLTVPTGVDGGRAAALRGARGGYRPVASVVATRVVAGHFPPVETRTGLRSDPPVPERIRDRYRRVGQAIGLERAAPAGADDVERANAALAAALADRLAPRLRARYDSPATAARAVETSRATVTVRRWEP